MPRTFPRGRFVWHDLMTTDPDAAIGFYTEAVGWGIMPWDVDASYRMWAAAGEPVGGVMRLPDEARQMGARPHWLTYVAVPDLDATVMRAVGMGAKMHVQPQDVPTVGRFAVLADPQGALFAAFTPTGEAPGHDGEPGRGEFSWHELAAADWQAAWDFYHALFGWQKTDAMDMGPGGTYQMFGRAGRTLGGMYNKPREMPAPPHWLCYALVRSADVAAETVRRLGGRVVTGPMDVPGGGRIAQCLDPQGARFAVHSIAVAAEPAPKREPAKPKRAAKQPRAAKGRPVKKAAPKRRPVKKGARPRKPVKKR